jgi:hypothetical protein
MAPRREPAQTSRPVRRFRMARAPEGYTVCEVTMKTLLLSADQSVSTQAGPKGNLWVFRPEPVQAGQE